MKYILMTLATAILFVLLILLLAVKPRLSKKITIGALTVAGVSGLFIYSYGYMAITENSLLAVLQALLAVCGSFVGNNKYSDFASVPIMQTVWMQIFFTFIQICALYATASAVISSLGKEALKKIRLWLAHWGRLNLIYGINEDALEFGKELAEKKRGSVVFIAENTTPEALTEVSAIGSVLLTDNHALQADSKFLKSIGFRQGNRKLTLYALSKKSTANIHYAAKLLRTLEAHHVAPENLRLVVSGPENVAVRDLQLTKEHYGYGFVSAISEPQMVARQLLLKHPPCNTVCFDSDGKATENFEALLIGFGQVGQAVLKAIVMNGQFEGSHFRLDVFSPNYTSADGSFSDQFSTLCEAYDICFHDHDGRSRQMYQYLSNHRNRLKYAVICTGNEDLNQEIAEDLTTYFANAGCCVPVFMCSRRGVEALAPDGTVAATHKLYHSDLLCSDHLDEMAMILNHRYQPNSDKTALKNWLECDYFSRQSCRASADFLPAMLRAAGKNTADVSKGDWCLTDAQKENLSKTEHLRWCAFHYCMGFSPMSDEEFDARANIYIEQVKQDGKPTIRIGKNMTGRTHACLIGWDELDRLSEKEAAIIGKHIDYRAMDTDNVMAIPELLKTAIE